MAPSGETANDPHCHPILNMPKDAVSPKIQYRAARRLASLFPLVRARYGAGGAGGTSMIAVTQRLPLGAVRLPGLTFVLPDR